MTGPTYKRPDTLAMPDAMLDTKDFTAQRQTMVDCQIRTFDVTDQRVIARFLSVPRERFLPDELRELAYSDIGFTIGTDGDSRYLLPPLVLARLIQGARVRPNDRVLDVACGAGYSTAVLAGLALEVVALEATPTLSNGAAARLSAAGLDVPVRTGDLAAGAPADGPFDVILVNGAIETGLDGLVAQLAEGGRLVTIRRDPVDPTGRAAKALCFERHGAEAGTRYLFDASAPVLGPFRTTPRFAF